MEKILVTVLLVLSAMSISAQTMQTATYSYDNAGNRTERVVVLIAVENPLPRPIMRSTTALEDLIAEKAILIYPNFIQWETVSLIKHP